MRKAVLLALAILFGLTVSFGENHANASAKPPPDWWVRLLGTAADDSGFGIAVDSSGNSYITGYTGGDLDGETNAGLLDVFVAKYSADGSRQWTRLLATVVNDTATGIAVDPEGTSYVTGYTRGDLENKDNRNNRGETDFFVAKYDASGNKQWTTLFGTPMSDNAIWIAVDSEGNSYITGATFGNLGGENQGSEDIFVAKYDTNGNRQWIKQFGTPQMDFGFGIAVDSSGNSYITGYTGGDLDGETNAGLLDVFVAKYNADGTPLWTRLLGTPMNDLGFRIGLDSNGNSYITGATFGDLDGETNAGGDDIFVAKYDASGNKQWTAVFGTPSSEYGRNIAVDSSGNSYITGATQGNLDGQINAGSNDIFVSKYDGDGTKQWTRLLGTANSDIGEGIAVDIRNHSHVTGVTAGDLAGNSNAGSNDIFVWKFGVKAMPWLLLLTD